MQPEPAKERRERHRAEARRSILDAAEALLIEDGLETFSIRRLAQRSGYSAPTLYHHFRDKDGLFDALLQERFEGHPVEIESLSRFRSAKDARSVIERLAAGTIDIAIPFSGFFSNCLSVRRPR